MRATQKSIDMIATRLDAVKISGNGETIDPRATAEKIAELIRMIAGCQYNQLTDECKDGYFQHFAFRGGFWK